MATEWNAQIGGGKYNLQFETNRRDLYKIVEKACESVMDILDSEKHAETKDVEEKLPSIEKMREEIEDVCDSFNSCDKCPLNGKTYCHSEDSVLEENYLILKKAGLIK